MTRAQPLTISVVIPTRHRPESLARTLRALGAQRRLPDEVIVVDASDVSLDLPSAQTLVGGVEIRVVPSRPSVSAQRNRGVALARGSHILLCDDDIEPDEGYVEALTAHVMSDPECGAVTGVLREPVGPEISFQVPSLRHLLFAFIFQLDVHADVGAMIVRWPGSLLAGPLRAWYTSRANTWSLAGWPLITRVETPVTTTSIYGLGAALIRRDWLLASPYDEGLGPHGVGDNYGVALGFPMPEGIAVLLDVPVLHHREAENRRPSSDAFVDRVMALDHFMRRGRGPSSGKRRWLVWSLLGRAAWFATRGPRRMGGRALGAAVRVALGRNPLQRRGAEDTFTAPVAPAA